MESCAPASVARIACGMVRQFWIAALDRMLSRGVRRGELSVRFPDGAVRRYGSGAPSVEATLHDDSLPRRIVQFQDLAIGEAYMDGTLTIADDDLRGLLELAIGNFYANYRPGIHAPVDLMRNFLRRLQQINPARRSSANVAHHYDLSGDLYRLFLDEDMQYSCGYFRDPSATLEEAQRAKKRHIAAKLLLEPGMRVLDIGSGWGGLAIELARDHGAEVLGVTLSREQLAVARDRAEREGLANRARFEIQDYRSVSGTFDRIVSVGMFEHVGLPQYGKFFGAVHDLLEPDGVALIHTIGYALPPAATSAWMLKYIFPGGYTPSMSEVARAIEKQLLYTTDVEVWRLHYAQTLRHWHDRFMANIDRARDIYDERFCRMWRFYLIGCEMTFRHGWQVVFQFQLARQQDAVPLTRDYIHQGG